MIYRFDNNWPKARVRLKKYIQMQTKHSLLFTPTMPNNHWVILNLAKCPTSLIDADAVDNQ